MLALRGLLINSTLVPMTHVMGYYHLAPPGLKALRHPATLTLIISKSLRHLRPSYLHLYS